MENSDGNGHPGSDGDVYGFLDGMDEMLFPGGPDEMASETDELGRRLGDVFPRKEVQVILRAAKFLMVFGGRGSGKQVIEAIISGTNGRFSPAQAQVVSDFVVECRKRIAPDEFAEPTGPPRPGVVVIHNRDRFAGIREEYAWIEERYGKRSVDWELVMQMHQSEGGRSYDVLEIKTSDGTGVTITFDISAFD